jgi:hypothetical protein
MAVNFTIKPEDLWGPEGSRETVVRTEDAADCDGVVCGEDLIDDNGQPFSPRGPHDHLIVSGREPKASPRYFAIAR